MEVALKVSGSVEEIADVLAYLSQKKGASVVAVSSELPVTTTAPKRGRPAKAATETPAEEPAEDFDLGSETEVEGDEGVEGEAEAPAPAPAPKKKAAPALTLEKDVIPAFQEYVKKSPKGKTGAAAVLSKFGVKSVRDLPADSYAKVLAALKV